MLLVCVDLPLSSYKMLRKQKRSRRQLRFISPSPVIPNWCKRVMQALGQVVDPNLTYEGLKDLTSKLKRPLRFIDSYEGMLSGANAETFGLSGR
jgi:hypothetical protein